MKRKNVIIMGIFSLVIFMGIASYLWYLYFNKYEEKLIKQNGIYEFERVVELANSGPTTYLNATNNDTEEIIPTYYFRVENESDQEYEYILYFQNVDVNDGCSESTRFDRSDLEYELKLDNKVIKKAGLETITNNELDINTISSHSINDYSIRLKLKENVTDYENKHFHYTITIKEKK